MTDLIEAFYLTWPLWAFLGILLGALVIKAGVDF
jgi:hypothetical protein